MKSKLSRFLAVIVCIFAVIGFVLVVGYVAIELGLTNSPGVVDKQEDFFKNQISSAPPAWVNTPEWRVLKEAVVKDREPIIEAARKTDLPPRIIVATLVVEQLRLFNSSRETYKAVFAPLKILGVQSLYSWGVMGIKQETAKEIENNLKDRESPWYLGENYEHLLDFKTNNPDKERFDRLTNSHDRTYSYIYAALLIKELEAQWKNAGFPIENKIDVIATLFNIGFDNSNPHTDPLSGGAALTIGGMKYSFGSLAKSFYDSEELIEEFPR